MNLLRAASLISLLSLASRITGLIREMLIAQMFGAGAWNDAYVAAFRIPNMLRRLFGEGAFSAAFVPILAAARERDGDVATRALIDAVATVLFLGVAADVRRGCARCAGDRLGARVGLSNSMAPS